MNRPDFSDQELDQLLSMASRPKPVNGAMDRIVRQAQNDNVVTLAPRRISPWLSALPLAASLACGIYLGAVSSASDYLPLPNSAVATADEDDGSIGIEDVVTLAEEDLS